MERPSFDCFDTRFTYLRTIYKSSASPTIVDLYQDSISESPVIVKKLEKSLIFSDYQLESAHREISIHSLMHHPNVIELYDHKETEKEFLLLMEYLPRHDYFTEKIEIVMNIQNNKPFNMKPDGDIEKLRSLSFDIVQGLDHIHSNGVVHMDMKPANLMIKPVSNPDEYPIVKIGDFGLSRMLGSDGTVEIEKRCGTDKYIAPEVKDGARVTPAVDIWCFGLILHVLTVGFLPFALKWVPGEPLKFTPRYWRKYENTGLTHLIEDCLKLDPQERINVGQVSSHEWFSCQSLI